MSITVELPPDLERDANRITDLDERLKLFVRQQVDLERWRSTRYSEKARRLVQESAQIPAATKPTREVEFERLLALQDALTRSS